MSEHVEPLKATAGGLWAQQSRKFFAFDVVAAGKGRRGDVDDVIGELRVELARDAKITGHDPIEFYLRAVGRELSLPGDSCARKILRVTAEQFPLWDALGGCALRQTPK